MTVQDGNALYISGERTECGLGMSNIPCPLAGKVLCVLRTLEAVRFPLTSNQPSIDLLDVKYTRMCSLSLMAYLVN